MKKILLIVLLAASSVLNAMLTTTSRLGTRTYPRAGRVTSAARRTPAAAAQPTVQKRTLYRPEQIKGLYSKLTETAQPVSPAIGTAAYESGILPKMYSVTETGAPAVKLVQTLFYRRDEASPVKPTTLKTNPAYSFTAPIIGFVVGALESGKLQDPTTRKSIMEQWRAEHKNVTNGDRISEKKVNDLLLTIEAAYESDKTNARSILLGFLYAKANPDNNHDMIHYLEGLNHFIPVFAEGQTIEKYTVPQTPSVSEQKSPSLMEKFSSLAQSLKNYIYTPAQYAAMRSTLRSMPTAERIEHAKSNFEESLGAILHAKQESNIYPPVVIQARYGFEGQPELPNCVETALQDLMNIILYNPETQTFDFSMLPSIITPTESFTQFYALQDSPTKVNSPEIGQAWMNLVSGITDIRYSMRNYELKAGETLHNLVTLINHFLGTNATDLESLGKALSNERRTITFEYKTEGQPKISMTINDHQNDKMLHADFCFRSGHGWLEVPERNKNAEDFLLNPALLAKEYKLSPQAQALFMVQPTGEVLNTIQHSMPASFYYAINIENDYQKQYVIKHILTFNSENDESVDYAYNLFKQLPADVQADRLDFIMKETNVTKSNKKFADIYKIIDTANPTVKAKVIDAIVTYDNTNEQAVDYAYSLYQSLSETDKAHQAPAIIQSGIQKTSTAFKNFYKTLEPQDSYRAYAIISAIIQYDSNNEEAMKYAYLLYQTVGPEFRLNLLIPILRSGVQKTDPRFKNIYTMLPMDFYGNKKTILSAILKYDSTNKEAIRLAINLYESLDKNDKESMYTDFNGGLTKVIKQIITQDNPKQEDIDYAYELYTELSPQYYYHNFEIIMESGIWKKDKQFSDLFAKSTFYAIEAAIRTDLFTVDTITQLYDIITNSEKKNRLLTLALEAVAQYSQINYVRNGKRVTVSDENLIAVTKKLVSLGCDINAPSKIKGSSLNKTPLFFAIEIGNDALIDLLVEHGANVKEPITSKAFVDYSNKLETLTPLCFAVMENPQIIPTLLKHGADINAKNSDDPNNNVTPLILAAQTERSDTVKQLLELGADPNVSGMIEGKKTTPLITVIKKRKVDNNEITAELIHHNANVNDTDSDGNTALDIALDLYKGMRFNNIDKTIDVLKKAGGKAYKSHAPKTEQE